MHEEHDTPTLDPEFRMLTLGEFGKLSVEERMAYLRRAVDALKTATSDAAKVAVKARAQAAAAPRAACRGR